MLIVTSVVAALVGVIIPTAANAVPLPPPAINNPPQTGQIISFPQRDFISATGWSGLYPFVDVEVWRPVAGNPDVRIGFAPNVIPDPTSGAVEVNHPGGACWSTVTPDIKAGDKVRLIGKDAGGAVQVIDETTTANVTVTSVASQVGPNTVEMRGTALRANGTPIAAAELEARLIGSSKDRFDVNGRRDLRAPRDGTFSIDAAGNWVADFTNLTAADISRAMAAENRVVWLGANPALGTEATIFEVGPLVTAGPSAPCTAPLQGAVVSTDRASVEFPATDVAATSAPERIRITNAGNGALAGLQVSSLQFSGVESGSFAVSANTCIGNSITVGNTCDVFLTFTPDAVGIKQAVLNIVSNAGNTLVPITASGLGTNGTPVAYGLATPGALGFGTRTVGNTGPAETVSIKNLGNTNLTISSRLIAGPNAADFVLVGDNCNSVGPNATCTAQLVFTPGAQGDRTATLTLSGNATVTIALSGGGLITGAAVQDPPVAPLAAGIFVARDFVSYEGFDADEVVFFQVIRHGVVIGTGTTAAGPDGIAEINHPGGGCWDGTTPNIRAGDIVRATRDAAHGGQAFQTTAADVKITSRAAVVPGNPNAVEIHGYARDLVANTPLPIEQLESRMISATANPFAINGKRAVRTPGEGSLSYDPVGPGNPDGTKWTATFDFSLSPTPAADVALAQTVDNRILWLGRDPLALTEMTFWEDDPANVIPGPTPECNAPLQPPSPGIVVSPQTTTFPGTAVGGAVNRTITLRNVGDAPLHVNSVSFGGNDAADFTVVGGLPSDIDPDETGTFQVRFSPVSGGAGTRTATVLVNDNVVGSPHAATLTGTVVAAPSASLTYAPATLTFPETQVGVDSFAKTVRVKNEGGASATISAIAANGNFRVVAGAGSCAVGVPLAVGNSCDVYVVFRPTAVGTRNGTLTVSSNDPTSPGTVALVGTSTVTVDGVNDPPLLPHSVEVFPVRDYVAAGGFLATDFVRFDVYRGGVLIATSDVVIPRDVDLTDFAFDGFVEINHVGGGCWVGATPDIRPTDVVRAVRLPAAGPGVLGGDQTHTSSADVSMPPVLVAPGTVVFSGNALDTETGLVIPAGQLEARLVSTGNAFEANGRRTVRTGLEGTLTVSGTQWTATFAGLSANDVATALASDSVVLWMGRNPLALNELTHNEWAEIPGPDPGCAAQAPFTTPEPTTNVAALTFPFGGLGVASAPQTFTFTNPAGSPGAVTISALPAIEGYNPGDFAITANTCTVGLTRNPGQSCSVTVRFTAAALGTRAATIRIRHTGANLVSFVPLTGTGIGAPTITSATSPVGRGGTVTIAGTQLASTTGVTIGGQNAVFTVVNDSQVTAIVPAATPTGAAVPVLVTTVGGSASITIQVNPNPPTITSVVSALPGSSGPIGSQVTVNGTNFTGATVTFNGVVAAATINGTGTSLTTTVPVGATTGPLKVETAGGAASVVFTVPPPPTVATFTPATARTGSLLTINGTNFIAPLTVSFRTAGGGTVTANPTVLSATQVRVTVPATAVQGPVTVTTGAGSGSAVFTVERAPSNITLAPATGPIGTTVTISGENFLQTSKVSFNGRNATTFTVVNQNTITAVVPSGATTGRVQVGNKWGSANSGANFTVIAAPTITNFTASGSAGGDAPITVNGTSFSSVTSVQLVQGATVINRAFTVASATQLTFRVGGVTPGLYVVRITNPAGTVSSVTALTVAV